jgi:hypothetical protein
MSPTLRQSIVEDRIEGLVGVVAPTADECFLRFVFSIVANVSYDELDPTDVVDGGQDKQLDVVIVDEDANAGTASVRILQTKNSDSFSSNALIQMANGLAWIFERPRSEYEQLANQLLVQRIREIREIRSRLGPSNLQVEAYFITKGSTATISDEFKQELGTIITKYSGGFGSFTFYVWGADEIVEQLNLIEKTERRIDDSLEIVYYVNRPSIMEYDSGGIRGVVCSVPGREIARLVHGDREKSVFDRNIRQFLGERGRVNPQILLTSADPTESRLFWFLNNGITIICDRFDIVHDPDNPKIILSNLQIVNGCQTSVSLSRAFERGELQDDVRVLVKIFQAADQAFVDRLVLTTNNQNTISSRDLKANDSVQRDYQRAFKDGFGLLYERKANEFRGLPFVERRRVVSNERVAQAYLAIVRKRPTIARTQRYRIWGPDLYEGIFPSTSVERHVLAYLIYAYCQRQKVGAVDGMSRAATVPTSLVKNGVLVYGGFHIARTVARLYTGTENWNDTTRVVTWIEQVRSTPEVLRPHYEAAVDLLTRIVSKHPDMVEELSNVFKASEIETEINRELNPPH